MLNVSQAIKDKFQSDVCRKELRITIGSTVLANAAIYKDGFKLTEAVMDGTVEFVGCIASMLEFKISTLVLAKGNYKGATVTAEVAVYLNDNSLSSYVPLFHGFVDECTKSADGYYQQFVCYDRLAYLSDEPGYNMYKAAFNGSSIDLETFRDAIVLDCGMDAVNSQTLPNDDIVFRKRKRNKDITAMALLRHIAQINGAFGILNRDNRFEFRQIDDSASPEVVAYYRDLKYSDYVVKPVGDSTTTPPTGSITIRTNSQDAGVTVDWTNYSQYVGTDPGWSDESQDTYLVDDDDANVIVDSYIIEGNLIAYKLKAAKKRVIGANILASLGHDAVFREHSVKCNGLPYVECCDKVLFTKADSSQIEFVVTKRVLEGVQNMTDTYSCTISSQDANNKTFVSNVDNSTNSLSGSPDDALGLTEKNITVNGTYSANDDGAEGYSQVVVNVPGGVGPHYIGEVRAMAVEDITAGDCVYIEAASSGTATQVSTNMTNAYSLAGFACDDNYIYFLDSTDEKIYRVPFDNLASTPELHISDVKGRLYVSMARKYLVYTDTSDQVYFCNADGSIKAYLSNTTVPFFYASKEYNNFNIYNGGWRELSTGDVLTYQASRPSGGDKVVLISSNYYVTREDYNTTSAVRKYHENTMLTRAVVNVKIYSIYWMMFGHYLVGYNAADYSLGYVDIDESGTSLTWHPILDQNGNAVVSSAIPNAYPQFNDNENYLWFDLRNNGIAIVDSSMNATVYNNITGANHYSQMLGDYFIVSASAVFYLGLVYSMGRTNDKTHAGSLGYVDADVQSSTIGRALILFS